MAENEEVRKKLQQKYLEVQVLDRQMKQVQKQVEILEQQISDLEEVQQNLDALARAKVGSEILVPIASGIFFKARLEDNKSLAVNAGSNTVVRKDVLSTKSMLAEQAGEMRKFQAELVQQFEKMAERAAELQKEMQELAGE